MFSIEIEPESKGRPKTVRYWRMSVIDSGHDTDHEVDELRWLTPEEAVAVLSYPHDAELVRSL